MADKQASSVHRFEELDSLRGIAAAVVVVAHFAGIFLPGAVFAKDGHFSWEILFVSTPLHLLTSGHLAVCMFFVLSGFVLTVRQLAPGERFTNQDLLTAALKRPVRLGGMVIVTELAGMFCWWQGWFVTQTAAARLHNSWLAYFWPKEIEAHDISALATGPFFYGVSFNPPLWTIELELYGSFMVFGMAAHLTRLAWGRLPVLIGMLMVLGRLPEMMRACGYDSQIIPAGHWLLLQGFVFGMMAAEVWHMPGLLARCWQSKPLRYSWLVVAVVFASFPYYGSAGETLYRLLPTITPRLGGGYPMLGAFMLFLLVLAGWGRGVLLSAPARLLGRLSYAIYGCHFIILPTITCGLYLYLDERGVSYPLTIIICLFVTLPLMLGCARLLARHVDTPSIRAAAAVGRWVRHGFQKGRVCSEACD
ncbi:MAG: acyltransferase [Prosthecobacter sp.]|uniref:acyltransferase family protein n=1 Tax=Prosthecobacter sp. TaxID=1965333 RepID=UPI003BAE9829